MADTRELDYLETLRPLFSEPGHYVERRVDHLRDLSERCAEWNVRLQVRLPIPAGVPVPFQPTRYLISLGIFPKKRLPDLVARDPSGAELSLVRRYDRSRALAVLLVQDPSVRAHAGSLARLAFMIVGSEPREARRYFDEYVQRATAEIGESDDLARHLDFVENFVSFTHVLAWVDGVPDESIVISYEFSERHAFPRRPALWGPQRQPLIEQLRFLGMKAGMLAVPFELKLSGANHSHSFYLMVDPPDGTEIETLAWASLTMQANRHFEGTTRHESRRAALGCYNLEHRVDGGVAQVSVRVDGRGLRTVWLLIAILTLLGFVAATHPKDSLKDGFALLSAVPAGLLAAISQRTSELGARISTWLRRAVLTLALVAGTLGVVVSDPKVLAKVDRGLPITITQRECGAALAILGTFLLVMATGVCFRSLPPASSSAYDTRVTLKDLADYRSARSFWSLLTLELALVGAWLVGWWLLRNA